MKKFTSLCLAVTGVLLTQVVYADSAKLVNPANGHSYQRFDAAKTWSQAKTACESLGAHLAAITSKAETDWVVNNKLYSLDSSFGTWLGGTDTAVEGTWAWITGEAFGYTNWYPGRPDNFLGNQDYIWLTGIHDGTWDDADNSSLAVYLCEWESSTAKPKLYSQVATVPDINSNGAPELALLGEQGTNYKLFVYDSLSNALLSESVIRAKKGYALKSFSVVNDSNGNGAPEVAILINKVADKTSVLQFQDTLSGDIVKTLNLPKN